MESLETIENMHNESVSIVKKVMLTNSQLKKLELMRPFYQNGNLKASEVDSDIVGKAIDSYFKDVYLTELNKLK